MPRISHQKVGAILRAAALPTGRDKGFESTQYRTDAGVVVAYSVPGAQEATVRAELAKAGEACRAAGLKAEIIGVWDGRARSLRLVVAA